MAKSINETVHLVLDVCKDFSTPLHCVGDLLSNCITGSWDKLSIFVIFFYRENYVFMHMESPALSVLSLGGVPHGTMLSHLLLNLAVATCSWINSRL